MQEGTAGALGNLAAGSEAIKAAIAAAGAVPPLALLLGHSSSDVLQQATGVLGRLADGNESRVAAIVAAGAVPALERLLHHSDSKVQEAAARELRSLGETKHKMEKAAPRYAGPTLRPNRFRCWLHPYTAAGSNAAGATCSRCCLLSPTRAPHLPPAPRLPSDCSAPSPADDIDTAQHSAWSAAQQDKAPGQPGKPLEEPTAPVVPVAAVAVHAPMPRTCGVACHHATMPELHAISHLCPCLPPPDPVCVCEDPPAIVMGEHML